MVNAHFKTFNTMDEQIKFYEWLLKIGNVYLNDNERMVRAFQIINENN